MSASSSTAPANSSPSIFVVPLENDLTMVIYKQNDSRYEGPIRGKSHRHGYGTLSWLKKNSQEVTGLFENDLPVHREKWKVQYSTTEHYFGSIREFQPGPLVRSIVPSLTGESSINSLAAPALAPAPPVKGVSRPLNFKDFLRHGVGEHSTGRTVYYGHFKMNYRSGSGVYVDFRRRIQYVGSFEKGMFHGEGLLRDLRESTLYCGNFKDGAISGQGELFLLRNRVCIRGTFVAEPVSATGGALDTKRKRSRAAGRREEKEGRSSRKVIQGIRFGSIFPGCVPDEGRMWSLLHDPADEERSAKMVVARERKYMDAQIAAIQQRKKKMDVEIAALHEGKKKVGAAASASTATGTVEAESPAKEAAAAVDVSSVVPQFRFADVVRSWRCVEYFVALFQNSYFQKNVFFAWACRDIASFVRFLMSSYERLRARTARKDKEGRRVQAFTLPKPSWDIGLEFVIGKVGDALLSAYRSKWAPSDEKFVQKLARMDREEIVDEFIRSKKLAGVVKARSRQVMAEEREEEQEEGEGEVVAVAVVVEPKKKKKPSQIPTIDKLLFPKSSSVLASVSNTTNVLKKIKLLELLRVTAIGELRDLIEEGDLGDEKDEPIAINADDLTEAFIILFSYCGIKDLLTQFNLVSDIVHAFYQRYATSGVMSVRNLAFGFFKYIEKTFEYKMYSNPDVQLPVKSVLPPVAASERRSSVSKSKSEAEGESAEAEAEGGEAPPAAAEAEDDDVVWGQEELAVKRSREGRQSLQSSTGSGDAGDGDIVVEVDDVVVQ